MNPRNIIVLCVAVALLSACSGTDMLAPQAPQPAAESSVHTKQPHLYQGEAGPEHWEGECNIGEAQSPIDIARTQAEDLTNIAFHYEASAVSLLNNGHTLQAKYPEGYEGYIELPEQQGNAATPQRYHVAQFHYHAPSEHTINGQSFAAELHIVHYKRDDPGQNPAVVIGILLEEGAENPAYAPFLADPPSEENEEVAEVEMNLAALLPSVQTSFRYVGSLTTPPCTEGITWVVMNTPVQLSAEQLGKLEAIWEGNNRPVQALNERVPIEDTTP